MADWDTFKRIVEKKRNFSMTKTKRDQSTSFDNYLAEANSWMDGEHLRPNPFNRKVWFKTGFPDADSGHDETCSIFKANDLDDKKKILIKLTKTDPRWIFDKCGSAIFFQAASDGDFYFFQQLGKSISSNQFSHGKTLKGLRWYVLEQLPIAAYITSSKSERKALWKKEMSHIRKQVIHIIEQNPSLENLSREPSLKNDTAFRKTAVKWYSKFENVYSD